MERKKSDKIEKIERIKILSFTNSTMPHNQDMTEI